MKRRINTEVGDFIRKDLKNDFNSSYYNFTQSKRYLRLKSDASESTVQLNRSNTINPFIFQQELISIDQTKLNNMTKQSIKGQTQQMKNLQQQDLNLQKKSYYLNKNLDRFEHKIVVNKD
ncbi:unnamed protein product [Paramecium primaurelia]|uniref:Uncharacterized protein n=1 Tax=Paramecium primaurelia TaxID=5886 RepID=A0A8S1M8H8_PARPR|nr:unnamed protein product [Paramecium primaurelia]